MQEQQNEFRDGREKPQQIISKGREPWSWGMHGCVFGKGDTKALEDHSNPQT